MIYGSTHKRKHPPPLTPNLKRVDKLNVLGVALDELFKFSEHVSQKLMQGHQQLYALKTLKAHGLSNEALHNVCNAVFLPTLTYASQAWWGFINIDSKQRLKSLISKTSTWQLDGGKSIPDIEDLCIKFDMKLFRDIMSNKNHVLHQLLPPIKSTPYNMRERLHNRVLPLCSNLTAKNFVNRMLFM